MHHPTCIKKRDRILSSVLAAVLVFILLPGHNAQAAATNYFYVTTQNGSEWCGNVKIEYNSTTRVVTHTIEYFYKRTGISGYPHPSPPTKPSGLQYNLGPLPTITFTPSNILKLKSSSVNIPYTPPPSGYTYAYRYTYQYDINPNYIPASGTSFTVTISTTLSVTVARHTQSGNAWNESGTSTVADTRAVDISILKSSIPSTSMYVNYWEKGNGSLTNTLKARDTVSVYTGANWSHSAPAIAGYKYVGYNLTSSNTTATSAASSIALTATSNPNTNSSVTLTYLYEKDKCSLGYSANGGTGTLTDPSSPYNPNSLVTVLSPGTAITKSGHNFVGWGTSAAGKPAYQPGDQFNLNANTTLYAQWEVCPHPDLETEAKEPSCDESGYTDVSCPKCGYSSSEKHPSLGHAWGEWTVASPPTCIASGEGLHVCMRDPSHIETHPIAADPDAHIPGEWVRAAEPTCTEPGREELGCQLCGTVLDDRPIDAPGHDMGEWYSVGAEICLDESIEGSDCQNDGCDHYETRFVDAPGHDWGDWFATAFPTCMDEGTEMRECARDALHIETRPTAVDPDAHKPGKWVESAAPTCTEPGGEELGCQLCGAILETKPVDPTGHKWSELWQDDPDWQARGHDETDTDGSVLSGGEYDRCSRANCGAEQYRPIYSASSDTASDINIAEDGIAEEPDDNDETEDPDENGATEEPDEDDIPANQSENNTNIHIPPNYITPNVPEEEIVTEPKEDETTEDPEEDDVYVDSEDSEDPDEPDDPDDLTEDKKQLPPPPHPPLNPNFPLRLIDPDDPIYENVADWLPPLGRPRLDKGNHYWYIRGYPDDTVKVDDYITCAEMAVIFYRLTLDDYKSETVPRKVFSDVDPGAWYAKAVTYLYDMGIIKGHEDGTFRPDASITRAEAAAMAIKFDDFTLPLYNPFYDLTTDHWAAIPLLAAWNNGWLFGYAEDATIRPEEKLTRAELVAFVNRVLGRLVTPEDIPDGAEEFADLQDTHWAYGEIMEASNSHDYRRKYADEDGNYRELDEIWTEIIGNGKKKEFDE